MKMVNRLLFVLLCSLLIQLISFLGARGDEDSFEQVMSPTFRFTKKKLSSVEKLQIATDSNGKILFLFTLQFYGWECLLLMNLMSFNLVLDFSYPKLFLVSIMNS